MLKPEVKAKLIDELLTVLCVSRNLPYAYQGKEYLSPEDVVDAFLEKVDQESFSAFLEPTTGGCQCIADINWDIDTCKVVDKGE